MTDLVTALADTSHLSPFEGLPVVQTGIEIPGAAPEVALARQHAAGVHSDGLREGCEQCEAEAAAVAEEAAEAPNNVSPRGRGKRK